MTEKTTTIQVLRGICDCCRKAKAPITPSQELLIAGGLAVWIEKIRAETRKESLLEIVRRERRAPA